MNAKWSKIVKCSNDILSASKDGFDSIEMSVDYIVNMSEEEFLFQKNLMIEKKLFCESCNSILPQNVIVTEEGFNIYVWMDYLKKAASRSSELGCKVFIWNNARARLLPMDDDSGHAKEQVFQFLYMLCDLLSHYNITLLIEPIGLSKTNYINTIKEAEQLLNIINKDNFSSLISINTLSEIGFENSDFEEFSKIIKYVYLEDPILCKNYNYANLFKNLHNINYEHYYCLPNSANKESLDYCKKIFLEL